jgi:hypothetical protein
MPFPTGLTCKIFHKILGHCHFSGNNIHTPILPHFYCAMQTTLPYSFMRKSFYQSKRPTVTH